MKTTHVDLMAEELNVLITALKRDSLATIDDRYAIKTPLRDTQDKYILDDFLNVCEKAYKENLPVCSIEFPYPDSIVVFNRISDEFCHFGIGESYMYNDYGKKLALLAQKLKYASNNSPKDVPFSISCWVILNMPDIALVFRKAIEYTESGHIELAALQEKCAQALKNKKRYYQIKFSAQELDILWDILGPEPSGKEEDFMDYISAIFRENDFFLDI